ncbi:hypothetical protein Hanom_Chr01g00093351 [Helianthus anomalus]
MEQVSMLTSGSIVTVTVVVMTVVVVVVTVRVVTFRGSVPVRLRCLNQIVFRVWLTRSLEKLYRRLLLNSCATTRAELSGVTMPSSSLALP